MSGLRGRAHQMGTLVAQQVETAVRALLESDREAAELVLRREQQINAWQTEIEAESFRLLARQAPVASDLRTVLAISRAVTDLERAGDESKKIARFALASAAQGAGGPSRVMHRPLRHMAELASESMRVAVDALDRGDASVAHEVARLDREIDQEFEAALRQLMTVAMERIAAAEAGLRHGVRAQEPRADRRPRQERRRARGVPRERRGRSARRATRAARRRRKCNTSRVR